MKRVPNRDESTYRCQVCGFECVSKKMAQSSRAITKRGDYGTDATPTPTTYDDEMYRSSTMSFESSPAKIVDADKKFTDKGIKAHWALIVSSGSGTNDGSYTIAERGVSRGEILLEGSLTDETTPGEVVLSRRIYKPNITTGCPFCGSLNSKE